MIPDTHTDLEVAEFYTELQQPRPLLVVLSGPSGVGKDATLQLLRDSGHAFHFVVTATTRPIRPGEADGIDYHFVGMGEFAEMIEQNELLEYAVVYGDYKGIPKKHVREALASDSGFTTMAPAQRAVTTFGIALAIAVPALQGVTDLCPPTPTEQAQIAERAAICQHLGRLLFDTPQTSMLQAQLGAQVARDYAEDDAARAQANEQLAALRSLGSALAADPLLSPGGDDPKATPEGLDQYLQWVIAEGEVAAMLGWLKRGRAGA